MCVSRLRAAAAVLDSIAKRPVVALQPRKENSLLRDFEALAEKYEAEGWYETSYSWYLLKVCRAAVRAWCGRALTL